MRKKILMALTVLFLGATANARTSAAAGGADTPDGVEAVDLGLSVKWANMNVGATRETGFGTYFAWGEVKPKAYYSWGTYAWSKANTQFLTKYSTTDRQTRLVASDDAARANWGGEWRMPTVEECEELTDPDKCIWKWTTKDGVNGYQVTGKKTGNSIFLPITGFRFYGEVQFRPVYGFYWTSSLSTANHNKAWCLEFNITDVMVHEGKLSSNRFSGRTIRAVR